MTAEDVISSNATITTTTATQPTHMGSLTTEITSAAALAIDPLSHVGDGIFLQTKTAQGIAGLCVWFALFLTCQQVRTRSEHCQLCTFSRRNVLAISHMYMYWSLSNSSIRRDPCKIRSSTMCTHTRMHIMIVLIKHRNIAVKATKERHSFSEIKINIYIQFA